MKPVTMQLVTIIAAAELEERLLHDIQAMGARGYTVVRVHGQGLHNHRAGELEGENCRIETIVDEATSQRIIDDIGSRHFNHWPLVLYTTQVNVLRPDRFISPAPGI